MKSFLHWKHKNIIFLLAGIIVTLVCLNSPGFNHFLRNLGKLGYLGAFLAGFLFIFTFTVATGAIILAELSKTLSPIIIPFAVLGAVLGDLFIFYFIRKGVVEEVTPIYEKITGHHLKKLLHTKYFAWTLPVIGALIIISPLPDELGISLMGFSQIRAIKLILISLFSHSIGMSMVVSLSSLIKV